jgi:hypothetical protein
MPLSPFFSCFRFFWIFFQGGCAAPLFFLSSGDGLNSYYDKLDTLLTAQTQQITNGLGGYFFLFFPFFFLPCPCAPKSLRSASNPQEN